MQEKYIFTYLEPVAAVGEIWSGRRGCVESGKFTTALPGMVGLSSIGLVDWPVPVPVFPVFPACPACPAFPVWRLGV